jgi:glucosylceramidase
VHQAHPDKDAYLTECSGGGWEKDSALLHMTRELIIGSIRGWARAVALWNLALDENAGPHLGGCKNCRGVVTIDSHTGALTRNDEYYVLAHASRFVHPGAQRIGSDGVPDNVAFVNPDGSLVLIAVNSQDDPRTVRVRCGAQGFEVSMPGRSVATFVWRQADVAPYKSLAP